MKQHVYYIMYGNYVKQLVELNDVLKGASVGALSSRYSALFL